MLFGGRSADAVGRRRARDVRRRAVVDGAAARVRRRWRWLVGSAGRVRLAPSKGEAARLIRGGGIYVNDRRVADEKARLRADDAIDGRLFVLRKGQARTTSSESAA